MDHSFESFVDDTLRPFCAETTVVLDAETDETRRVQVTSLTNLVIQDENSLLKSYSSTNPVDVARSLFADICKAIQLRPRQAAHVILLSHRNTFEQTLMQDTEVNKIRERARGHANVSLRDRQHATMWSETDKIVFIDTLTELMRNNDNILVPAVSDIEYERRMLAIDYSEDRLKQDITSHKFSLVIHYFPSRLQYDFVDGQFQSRPITNNAMFGDTPSMFSAYTLSFVASLLTHDTEALFTHVEWKTEMNRALAFLLAQEVSSSIKQPHKARAPVSLSIHLSWIHSLTKRAQLVFPLNVFHCMRQPIPPKTRVRSPAVPQLLILFGWIAQPFGCDSKQLRETLKTFDAASEKEVRLEFMEKELWKFLKEKRNATPEFSQKALADTLLKVAQTELLSGEASANIWNLLNKAIPSQFAPMVEIDNVIKEMCQYIQKTTTFLTPLHWERLFFVFWSHIDYLLCRNIEPALANDKRALILIDMKHTLETLERKYKSLSFASTLHFQSNALCIAYSRSLYAPVYQYLSFLKHDAPLALMGNDFPNDQHPRKEHIVLHDFGDGGLGNDVYGYSKSENPLTKTQLSLPTFMFLNKEYKNFLLSLTRRDHGRDAAAVLTYDIDGELKKDRFLWDVLTIYYPRWFVNSSDSGNIVAGSASGKSIKVKKVQQMMSQIIASRIFANLDNDIILASSTLLLALCNKDCAAYDIGQVSETMTSLVSIEAMASFFQSVARLQQSDKSSKTEWAEIVSLVFSLIAVKLGSEQREILTRQTAFIKDVHSSEDSESVYVTPAFTPTKPQKTPTPSKSPTNRLSASISSSDSDPFDKRAETWQQKERSRRDEFEALYLRLLPYAAKELVNTSLHGVLSQLKARQVHIEQSIQLLLISKKYPWAAPLLKLQQQRLDEITFLVKDVSEYLSRTFLPVQRRQALLTKYPAIAAQQGIDLLPQPSSEPSPGTKLPPAASTSPVSKPSGAGIKTPKKPPKLSAKEMAFLSGKAAVKQFIEMVLTTERLELSTVKITEILHIASLLYTAHTILEQSEPLGLPLDQLHAVKPDRFFFGKSSNFSFDSNSKSTKYLWKTADRRSLIANEENSRVDLLDIKIFSQRAQSIPLAILDVANDIAQKMFTDSVQETTTDNHEEISDAFEKKIDNLSDTVLTVFRSKSKDKALVMSLRVMYDLFGLPLEFALYALGRLQSIAAKSTSKAFVGIADKAKFASEIISIYNVIAMEEYIKYLSLKSHDIMLRDGTLFKIAEQSAVSHRLPFKFYNTDVSCRQVPYSPSAIDEIGHSGTILNVYYIPHRYSIATKMVPLSVRLFTPDEQRNRDEATRIITHIERLTSFSGVYDLERKSVEGSYAVIDQLWDEIYTDRTIGYGEIENEAVFPDTFKMPGIRFLMAQSLQQMLFTGGAPLLIVAVLFDDRLLPVEFDKDSFVLRLVMNKWFLQKPKDLIGNEEMRSRVLLPEFRLLPKRLQRSVYTADQFLQTNLDEVKAAEIIHDESDLINTSDIVVESKYLPALVANEVFALGRDQTDVFYIMSDVDSEFVSVSFSPYHYIGKTLEYAEYIWNEKRDQFDDSLLLPLAKQWVTSELVQHDVWNHPTLLSNAIVLPVPSASSNEVREMVNFCKVMARHLDEFVKLSIKIHSNSQPRSIERAYLDVYLDFWLAPYNRPHRFIALLEWRERLYASDALDRFVRFDQMALSVFVERCVNRHVINKDEISAEVKDKFQEILEKSILELKEMHFEHIIIDPLLRPLNSIFELQEEEATTPDENAEFQMEQAMLKVEWNPANPFEESVRMLVDGKFNRLQITQTIESLLTGSNMPLDIDNEEINDIVQRMGTKGDTDAVRVSVRALLTLPISYTIIDFLTTKCRLDLRTLISFQNTGKLGNGIRFVNDVNTFVEYLFGCLQVRATDAKWDFLRNNAWWKVPKKSDANVYLVPTADQKTFIKNGPLVSKLALYNLFIELLDQVLLPLALIEFYQIQQDENLDGTLMYRFFVRYMEDLQQRAADIVSVYENQTKLSSTIVRLAQNEKDDRIRKNVQQTLTKHFGGKLQLVFQSPLSKNAVKSCYNVSMPPSLIQELCNVPDIVELQKELAIEVCLNENETVPFDRLPIVRTTDEYKQQSEKLRWADLPDDQLASFVIVFRVLRNNALALETTIDELKNKILAHLRRNLPAMAAKMTKFDRALESLEGDIREHVAILCKFKLAQQGTAKGDKQYYYEPTHWLF